MNNNSAIIEGIRYTTGDRVVFEHGSTLIEYARIYIDNNGADAYLCHNKDFLAGAPSPDMLGYSYSWVIGYSPNGTLDSALTTGLSLATPACIKPRDA